MNLRICFVGDSYVDGTGDPDCLGWAGRICRSAWARGHSFTFYNLGVRGDTSACVERRWRKECEARIDSYDGGRLVFSFGINDGAVDIRGSKRLALHESLDRARHMIEEAAAWLPTIWVGPPPANEKMSPISPRPGVHYNFSNDHLMAANEAFLKAAHEIGVPYLDIASSLVSHPQYQESLLNGDGIHCSGEGYAIIASMVDAWEPWRQLSETGSRLGQKFVQSRANDPGP